MFNEQFPAFVIIAFCVFVSITAQVIKIIIHFCCARQWDWKRLKAAGGMPSSHSGFMSALATSVGFAEGFGSTSFAICVCVGIIVMHDAMNLRYSVGIQAQTLNNLNNLFKEVVTEIFSEKHEIKFDKIKELLGHTPVEVIAGMLYGILFTWVAHSFLAII